MDENYRQRPPAESFLLVVSMSCPGVLIATLFHLNDVASSRFTAWMTPYVLIPLFLLVLAGCCWFAGWILASDLDEGQRAKASFDTGLLLLAFQFLLAPLVAFLSTFLFHQLF